MSLTWNEFCARFDKAGQDNSDFYSPKGQQIDIVRSTDPAILVVAGAGSGKTATMAHRIAWHIACGNVAPHEVLGITFTRKATAELAERVRLFNSLFIDDVATRLGGDSKARLTEPTIMTYNSFGAMIAQSYGLFIGKDPDTRLITDAERAVILEEIITALPSTRPDMDAKVYQEMKTSTLIDAALTFSDALLGAGKTPDELAFFYHDVEAYLKGAEAAGPKQIRGNTVASKGYAEAKKFLTNVAFMDVLTDVITSYWQYLEDNKLCEFGHQIRWAEEVVRTVPAVADELCSRYKLILLDEYQDTSINQATFLYESFRNAESVCAVGDPNQAIYGFRGASANALSDFQRDFKVRTVLPLSSTYRNEPHILEVANGVTSYLSGQPVPGTEPPFEYGIVDAERSGFTTIDVEALTSSTTVKMPEARHEVRQIHTVTDVEGYRQVADILAEEIALDPTASIGILCRTRREFEPIYRELTRRGLAADVVGGFSLLDDTFISTIRAGLVAAIDMQRSDALLLLTDAWAIGARDLYALSRFTGGKDTPMTLLQRLDLLASLNPDSDADWDVRTVLSEAGYSRLRRLGQALQTIRTTVWLPLEECVHTAADALGLLAEAHASSDSARKLGSLSRFEKVARNFRLAQPDATLSSFLDYIASVEEREKGGEDNVEDAYGLFDGDAQTGPGAPRIQILTQHKSKGLAWDIVVIPGLVQSARSGDNWVTSKVYPYPLRADSAHVPAFGPATLGPLDTVDKIIVGEEYSRFSTELEAFSFNEAARLFYVAITRARRALYMLSYEMPIDEIPADLLSDHHATTHTEEEISTEIIDSKRQWKQISTLLRLIPPLEGGRPFDSGPLYKELGADLANHLRQVAAVDEHDAHWPRPRTHHSIDFEPETDPARVSERLATLDALEAFATTVAREDSSADVHVDITRIPATQFVSYAKDPDAFARNYLRPVPQAPAEESILRGNAVHDLIAAHFNVTREIDFDDDVDVDGTPLTTRTHIVGVEECFQRFLELPMAHWPVLSIEEPRNVLVGSTNVPCKLDAVFNTSEIEGMPAVTIIDWKTGRCPSESELAARDLQLAIYRQAWIETTGETDIATGFVFLGEKDPARRVVYRNVENVPLEAIDISDYVARLRS